MLEPINEAIENMIQMSRIAGMRSDLIQAGGGNTSVKLSKTQMAIKSSGIQLSELSSTIGISYVNPKIIIDALLSTEEINEQELLNQSLLEGKRPSIETFLHAFTNTYTLHTHPLLINVISTRPNGMKVLEELMPEALLIEYATPGLPLAKKIFEARQGYILKNKEVPKIVVLKNHGLIVSASTALECVRLTNEVLSKLETYLKLSPSIEVKSENIYTYFKDKMGIDFNNVVYWVNNSTIRKAFYDYNEKVWDFQFCPDAIVYCGKRVFNFSEDDFEKFIELNGKPNIVLYEKEFFILAQNVKKAKDIESLFEFTAKVASMNRNFSMDLLSVEEQDFLLNWDSEKYRQKI